ncbi:glutamate-1-semialdehyde 2,1-aminomutase [Leucobacter chromiiresistens]|uniref:Glutamate-1-semialdehyde 2,1-aminomutase n=2 Tax=Leucobacter chromiiresistens TaxID=1079994 RepID=A0A1H0YVB5_9MICO|nr:glutamate-1-semialdehyde 2,1-aminomutase [Leucobacter chromiiresistens]SDQ19187.1 glutamate-1-semialdehyde 2,1-aminomutase [Leucobacter chromiiresistens]
MHAHQIPHPEAAASAALSARAARVIPGGVNSPVRAYGSVGGTPRFLVSGSGPYVTDVDGNEYVDLVASWGPALLGHAHPAVVDAVQQTAARGLGFGASVPQEAELAEEIIARMPVVERVRLVSTGTEATMTAIRIARGATRRPLVIKFAGHYHGHSDGLLAEAGSGLATLAMPGSAGVTAETAAQTLVLPYNDLDALEAAFAEHGDRIAAVIAESAAANMGVLPPMPGFTEAMIRLAHAHGALVILDEVLTGFRAGPSGFWGIEQDRVAAGVAPDLLTFGKVVGGGLPLAALGGRAELMELLAPLGPVYQAGTLSGNPLAVAAGLTTLQHADAAAYSRLSHAADVLTGAVTAALADAGVPHRVQRAGTLFSVLFGEFPDAPRGYAEVQQQNVAAHRAFFHAMLEQGVNLPPSAFEAWFVTAAHDDAALARVVDALPGAARAAAGAGA